MQSLLNGIATGPSQHFSLYKNYATVDHAERPRGAWRKIKHTMLPKRTAIIDGHCDASAAFWIGDVNAAAEWQRPVRGGKAVAVRGVKGAQP